MARHKKRKRPAPAGRGTVKITPASLLGIGIGLLLIFTGAYSAFEKGEYGGFYVVALGVVFSLAVAWGVFRRR
jgi:hypothetical protein